MAWSLQREPTELCKFSSAYWNLKWQSYSIPGGSESTLTYKLEFTYFGCLSFIARGI